MRDNRSGPRFLVCVYNGDYPASLQIRKIYERLPDPRGERDGLVRVIDEEGEDYLYPASYFIPLDVSKDVEKAIESAAELDAQHR
jgi:hypothetical protein